jgi:thioredoxin 1
MTPAELKVLNSLDAVEGVLGAGPVLLLAWRDSSPRRDAEIALREVADQHSGKLAAYMVDARQDDALADYLGVGKRPVLIAWYAGEVRIRRNRPWKTDVPAIAEDLLAMRTADLPEDVAAEEDAAENATADDKPVAVTEETFTEKVIQSPVPVIVDFWAEWCGPCKAIAPVLEKLAKEYAGQIRIAKVDVDANQALAGQFGIQSIPTLMFVKNGKIVGQSAGAAPEGALRDVIRQLLRM